MKKSLLILAAASAVGFASCGGGNNEGSLTPAQLDSIQQATRQATEDSIANAQKRQSDSLVNAQNATAVDSLKRVNDSLAAVAAKPATKPATPTKKPAPSKNTGTKPQPVPEVVEPAKPVNPKDARFGNEEAKKKTQEANTNAKDARFK